MMVETWWSTVLGDMPSKVAIALFERPLARSLSTESSPVVRPAALASVDFQGPLMLRSASTRRAWSAAAMAQSSSNRVIAFGPEASLPFLALKQRNGLFERHSGFGAIVGEFVQFYGRAAEDV